jgi:hypothetical protein
MSNCVSCNSPPAPCACTSSQVCVQQPRTCSSCPVNVCLSSPSSKTTKSGSNLGQTLGGTLGGVFGGLCLIIGIGWWVLKKKRVRRIKLEREREFRREEKEKRKEEEKRKTGNFVTNLPKFTPKDLETVEEEEEPDDVGSARRRSRTRRSLLGTPSQSTLNSSLEVNAHSRHPPSPSPNPFSDENSVVGSKGRRISAFTALVEDNEDSYTIRSSQSTSIIPIAYIPAHSASPAISDLQNLSGIGEKMTGSPPSPTSSLNGSGSSSSHIPNKRTSFPQSLARTSVGSALNMESIDLPTPPPPLTSPVLGQMTVNGIPIRPPRAPGLDLKLPTVKTGDGVGSAVGVGKVGQPLSGTLGGKLSPGGGGGGVGQ